MTARPETTMYGSHKSQMLRFWNRTRYTAASCTATTLKVQSTLELPYLNTLLSLLNLMPMNKVEL